MKQDHLTAKPKYTGETKDQYKAMMEAVEYELVRDDSLFNNGNNLIAKALLLGIIISILMWTLGVLFIVIPSIKEVL